MRPHNDDVLVIGSEGDIEGAGAGAKATLTAAAGSHRVMALGKELVLLHRVDANDTQLLLAGEILSRTTLMEATSMIAQAQWEGELEIHAPGSLRRFRIADSALCDAWSNVLSERLGEVMVSGGLLTPDQLARCVLEANPKRRIGEIAMDRGFLTQEQLFSALRMQVQRIFQNALIEESGHYAMLRRREGADASAPMLFMHLPLQGLLMQSVQRIDEMALFRERIPNGHCCPVLTARAMRISLAGSLHPVVALVDGEHSILDIAKVLHSDEYQTTKRIAQLLQIGAIEIKAQRKLDEAEALRVIARFNQVLRRIFETVTRYDKKSDIHWTLDAWIRDTELRTFFEGALRPEGTIDATRALQHLKKVDAERPIEALQQALHELAGFAMLSAGSTLPREAERTLSHLVNQKLTHLRRE